jgi:phosphoglycerol transferase
MFKCRFNKKIPLYFLFSLVIFVLAINTSLVFKWKYEMVPAEQILFHFMMPMEGANLNIVKQVVIESLYNTAFLFLFLLYPLSIKADFKGHCVCIPFNTYKKLFACLALLLPVTGIACTAIAIGLPEYLLSLLKKPATFYEENYIHPENIGITFPSKKRNLIVIMVESLETGFLTIENGGAFTEDLMPEVAALAAANINYSGTEGIGGPVHLPYTGWTVAGIVSYYSGVPLSLNFPADAYGEFFATILPGASGLGDILHNAGYKNFFILGSDIKFAGRDKYFATHKETAIFDYGYFLENNHIPNGYYVWWGIEDSKLYDLAKIKITEIAQEEPFFITLLTADTHADEMYLDEKAERIFDSRYKNVLRDASKQLSSFVEWLKEQPFYNNTTIVILGDHLFMNGAIFPAQFKAARYPLNIFINSLLNPNETKNRDFSHFDMFPTLIESIGGTYDSEGLALGRSLNKPGIATLLEIYGLGRMAEQLSRKSKLYNKLWGATR